MEKDQDFSTLKIHDVITISKHQKTGEDGQKLGYSFYAKDSIAVVVQVGLTQLVVKNPDGEDDVFNTDVDKEYYYTFNQASELAYKNAIKKNIEKLQKEVDTKTKELDDSKLYLEEFMNEISLLGRIYRFMEFSKK